METLSQGPLPRGGTQQGHSALNGRRVHQAALAQGSYRAETSVCPLPRRGWWGPAPHLPRSQSRSPAAAAAKDSSAAINAEEAMARGAMRRKLHMLLLFLDRGGVRDTPCAAACKRAGPNPPCRQPLLLVPPAVLHPPKQGFTGMPQHKWAHPGASHPLPAGGTAPWWPRCARGMKRRAPLPRARRASRPLYSRWASLQAAAQRANLQTELQLWVTNAACGRSSLHCLAFTSPHSLRACARNLSL